MNTALFVNTDIIANKDKLQIPSLIVTDNSIGEHTEPTLYL